jgi:CHASE3 domain sensor protein
MKEGYLQIKIRELDYKLKQQIELSENLERQLQLIINSKKEYKVILNKLKQLDKFKDDIQKKIIHENKLKIQSSIEDVHKKLKKRIHDDHVSNFNRIKKYVNEKIDQIQKNRNSELINKNFKNIIYNEQLCLLLMEELIRERIFSNERIDILQKRASIRAKKKDE